MIPGPTLLRVQVLSPKGLQWEGEAQSVSSVNSQGPFDLLPQHAHFISLVKSQPIVLIDRNGKEYTLKYETAVVRLFDDIVTIYADV